MFIDRGQQGMRHSLGSAMFSQPRSKNVHFAAAFQPENADPHVTPKGVRNFGTYDNL